VKGRARVGGVKWNCREEKLRKEEKETDGEEAY
jgi:hypothetical protein